MPALSAPFWLMRPWSTSRVFGIRLILEFFVATAGRSPHAHREASKVAVDDHGPHFNDHPVGPPRESDRKSMS